MKKIKRFDSISDYMRFLENGKIQEVFVNKQKSLEKDNVSFFGTASYEEADNLLTYGDKTNLSKLNDSLHKLQNHKGDCTKQVIYSDVCGFAPNVQNYIAGLPMNMLNAKTKQFKGGTKIVNIVLNRGVDGGWSAESVIEQGIKVLDFLISLEKQGYRVNLYVFNLSKEGRDVIAQAVRVKRSDDRLNIAKLAYPMVNPSWQRRHFFRLKEILGEKSSWVGGYGSSLYQYNDVKDYIKELGLKVDYYFDLYNLRYEPKIDPKRHETRFLG